MTQLSCHKCGCPLADPSLRVPFILIGKHHFCSRTCVEAWLADLPDAFEIVGDLLITITETMRDWAGWIDPGLGRPQSPALIDPVSSGVFSEGSPLREPQGAPQHKEAFCLMRYTCRGCGFNEIIWNSRDGVTPFVTACPRCYGELTHVDWQNDRPAPDHIPEPGQGVWIDLPASLRRSLALRRLQSFAGTEFEIDEQAEPERFAATVAAIQEGGQTGEPYLIRWPDRAPVNLEE